MALSPAELVDRIEALRIPAQPQAVAHDWKDWFHVVLLHAPSGWRAIANVNLAGGGDDAELQWTLVVHRPNGADGADGADGAEGARGVPGLGLHGASRSQPWRSGMVASRPLAVAGDEAAFGFDGRRIALRIAPRDLDLQLSLHALPASTPLLVTEGAPFGSGFIGWGLLPQMRAEGRLAACGESAAVGDGWFCYHDHNFGRFRWGDDVGWEWLVAHADCADEAVTVVVDRRTDRAHAGGGLPYLFVLVGGALRKVFLGPAMRLRWHWHDAPRLPPRLPGAMATRLADRPVRRPRAVTLEAADERDRIALSVDVDAYLEVVAPDNRSAGFARIGETSGAVSIDLRLADRRLEGRGLAYAEYTR
jgi:hypothetical protein